MPDRLSGCRCCDSKPTCSLLTIGWTPSSALARGEYDQYPEWQPHTEYLQGERFIRQSTQQTASGRYLTYLWEAPQTLFSGPGWTEFEQSRYTPIEVVDWIDRTEEWYFYGVGWGGMSPEQREEAINAKEIPNGTGIVSVEHVLPDVQSWVVEFDVRDKRDTFQEPLPDLDYKVRFFSQASFDPDVDVAPTAGGYYEAEVIPKEELPDLDTCPDFQTQKTDGLRHSIGLIDDAEYKSTTIRFSSFDASNGDAVFVGKTILSSNAQPERCQIEGIVNHLDSMNEVEQFREEDFGLTPLGKAYVATDMPEGGGIVYLDSAGTEATMFEGDVIRVADPDVIDGPARWEILERSPLQIDMVFLGGGSSGGAILEVTQHDTGNAGPLAVLTDDLRVGLFNDYLTSEGNPIPLIYNDVRIERPAGLVTPTCRRVFGNVPQCSELELGTYNWQSGSLSPMLAYWQESLTGRSDHWNPRNPPLADDFGNTARKYTEMTDYGDFGYSARLGDGGGGIVFRKAWAFKARGTRKLFTFQGVQYEINEAVSVAYERVSFRVERIRGRQDSFEGRGQLYLIHVFGDQRFVPEGAQNLELIDAGTIEDAIKGTIDGLGGIACNHPESQYYIQPTTFPENICASAGEDTIAQAKDIDCGAFAYQMQYDIDETQDAATWWGLVPAVIDNPFLGRQVVFTLG